MIFKMDQRKAIEAAGILLRLTRHRMMDRKRLLALLFHSERESLKRTGRPIIGGRISAMKYGPVHSEVYDLIKGGGNNQAEWSRHFENDDYRIVLADDDLRVSALSRFEIDLLNEISAKFAGFGTWDVADASHTEEYEKNYKPETSTQIPLEDMIEGVGRKADKEAILKDAEEKNYFDQLFAVKP